MERTEITAIMDAVGEVVADEIKSLRDRLAALESRVADAARVSELDGSVSKRLAALETGLITQGNISAGHLRHLKNLDHKISKILKGEPADAS